MPLKWLFAHTLTHCYSIVILYWHLLSSEQCQVAKAPDVSWLCSFNAKHRGIEGTAHSSQLFFLYISQYVIRNGSLISQTFLIQHPKQTLPWPYKSQEQLNCCRLLVVMRMIWFMFYILCKLCPLSGMSTMFWVWATSFNVLCRT